MSPTRSPKHSTVSPVVEPRVGRSRAIAQRAACGPGSRSGHVGPGASVGPVQASVSAASAQAGRVPAIGCIVGTHARSRQALRFASLRES